MSLKSFEEFLFGAVLLDWDAEGEKMRRIKERFDRGCEVRIVGAETDLRFSLEGREGEVDDGHANMPGGEVFYSPVEESTEGVVSLHRVPRLPGAGPRRGRPDALSRAARSSRPRRRRTRRR